MSDGDVAWELRQRGYVTLTQSTVWRPKKSKDTLRELAHVRKKSPRSQPISANNWFWHQHNRLQPVAGSLCGPKSSFNRSDSQ
ncbi:hypothetical protein FRC07_002898, partial [Ceratobasidium sp. 392]